MPIRNKARLERTQVGPSTDKPAGDPFLLSETDKPQQLLHRFRILSAASIVVILVLAGTGIYRAFNDEMIRVAEQWSVYIGNTIYDQDRDIFLENPIPKEKFDQIDARMKKFLISFDMYKIKAFAKDKTIIYSTDHKIVGKVEGNNPNLDQTLAGKVVAMLVHKDKVHDLTERERLKVDVVETYVPVRADGVIVGAFEVYIDITPTRNRIKHATQAAILVLAAVLVVVFGLLYIPMRKGTRGLKDAHEKLASLASIDGLTGIFNRRFLLARVNEERDRMMRGRRELKTGHMSFAMADIDFFKKVNDVHGHLAGDAVLREVSERLKKGLRSYDVLGRYGGEEFLVMLPNTDLAGALGVANRMHQAVGARPIMCNGVPLTVTVSIGVADTRAPDEEITHVINRADEALYAAKDSGRDRVCCAEPENPAPV